jgi:hypothetical protein
MKPSVAITLIISGAALVAVPPLATAWQAYLTVQASAHSTSLAPWVGDIGDLYRLGCWVLGATMIFTGIASCFVSTPAAEFDSRLARA